MDMDKRLKESKERMDAIAAENAVKHHLDRRQGREDAEESQMIVKDKDMAGRCVKLLKGKGYTVRVEGDRLHISKR